MGEVGCFGCMAVGQQPRRAACKAHTAQCFTACPCTCECMCELEQGQHEGAPQWEVSEVWFTQMLGPAPVGSMGQEVRPAGHWQEAVGARPVVATQTEPRG